MRKKILFLGFFVFLVLILGILSEKVYANPEDPCKMYNYEKYIPTDIPDMLEVKAFTSLSDCMEECVPEKRCVGYNQEENLLIKNCEPIKNQYGQDYRWACWIRCSDFRGCSWCDIYKSGICEGKMMGFSLKNHDNAMFEASGWDPTNRKWHDICIDNVEFPYIIPIEKIPPEDEISQFDLKDTDGNLLRSFFPQCRYYRCSSDEGALWHDIKTQGCCGFKIVYDQDKEKCCQQTTPWFPQHIFIPNPIGIGIGIAISEFLIIFPAALPVTSPGEFVNVDYSKYPVNYDYTCPKKFSLPCGSTGKKFYIDKDATTGMPQLKIKGFPVCTLKAGISGESDTIQTSHFSIYMARDSNGIIDGDAYEFFPTGTEFASDVSIKLHNSSDKNILLFNDFDPAIKECKKYILKTNSARVGASGGRITLDEAELTVPVGALIQDTTLTINKINIDCFTISQSAILWYIRSFNEGTTTIREVLSAVKFYNS